VPLPPTKEITLAHIEEARRHERNAELELRRLVAHARRQGIWWEEIGNAMGVTKQAAQQRFGRDAIGD
jgi:hypothetical protein